MKIPVIHQGEMFRYRDGEYTGQVLEATREIGFAGTLRVYAVWASRVDKAIMYDEWLVRIGYARPIDVKTLEVEPEDFSGMKE